MEIASRRRRVFAFLIDHFLFVFVGVFAAFISMGKNWDLNGLENTNGLTFALIAVTLFYLCKDIIGGQSLGKRVFSIKTVDYEDENNTPSSVSLVLRNIFIFLWPIEIIVLVFSKEKRRLGDRIAGTKVVRITTSLKPRAILAASLLVTILAAFVTLTPLITKNSAAYAIAIQALEKSNDVHSKIGNIESFGKFPTGSIKVHNGIGRATIEIHINGESEGIDTVIRLTKQVGQNWKVIDVKFIE